MLRRLALALTIAASNLLAQADPLPSWNDGAAKKAIVDFVQATTTAGRPTFVPEGERIATFDQDGTLWVEQPMYVQIQYCFDHLPAGEKHPSSLADLERLCKPVFSGMTTEQFEADVRQWADTAQNRRWKKRYVDLTYLPMQDLMKYLRANGYRTYIVTGGGQDFVRAYAKAVYDIPSEQVIGTAGGLEYAKATLLKQPKILFDDNNAGKPEGIHLVIGRRPNAAFGNSTGDRQMLEYTKAGSGARLAMLVLHDDAKREYAYGPAQGLPDSKVGTFTQPLYDEAIKNGWVVISMKNDWRKIFCFEK